MQRAVIGEKLILTHVTAQNQFGNVSGEGHGHLLRVMIQVGLRNRTQWCYVSSNVADLCFSEKIAVFEGSVNCDVKI